MWIVLNRNTLDSGFLSLLSDIMCVLVPSSMVLVCKRALPTGRATMPPHLQPRHLLPLLLHVILLCLHATAWPHDSRGVVDDKCPSSEWNHMCRDCCEYQLIQCRCPSQGAQVGYSVPCCRNQLDQCDPCIIHPGCSLFENCKTCHNGTWEAKDDFFIRGRFCTDCRQGWAGGDCKTCGGVIRRVQGHIMLESYPINAHCEWRVQVERGENVELRFSMLSLEPDHNCHYDYVELRDGDSLSSPVIGRFCGNELPPPIRTSGSRLHVLFVSDGYNNFDGFFAAFQQSSACSPSPCQHHGTCLLDPVQSFRCACLAGYTGQLCENVARSQVCVLPARPVNGELLSVYGLEDELLAVQYLCHPPYTLTGTPQRTCLPNATWSGTVPICGKVEKEPIRPSQRGADPVRGLGVCPPPARLHHGYLQLVRGSGGGPDTVDYFCNTSYILSGGSRSTCLPDGSWSGRQPLCVRACREPKVSELVRHKVVKPKAPSRQSPVHGLHTSARHKVYDSLPPGMDPPSSGKLPSTQDPILGDLPRGFHHLYTSIEYECASSLYQHYGSPRRTCLKTGRWSGRHVSCSSVCGQLPAAFNPQNLTEIGWPWHAAIYLRSHIIRSAGSGLQAAPEEASSPWQLACSGALVTQLSVLVAAHCLVVAGVGKPQWVDPADIKVVMGIHSPGQMRTLKQLQVSSVLVHPSFDPVTMDSDLAVLKLRDKAKISERVLPVCLPKMQGGEVTATQGYATGWLLASDSRSSSTPSLDAETAQTGVVELGDVVQCERQFAQSGAPVTITDNMLCAMRQPLNPTKPCPTVSAGITIIPSPATKPSSGPSEGQGDDSVVWELLALESFGSEKWNCGPGLYTVHTRINNFKDWIQKNMQ
ncbi:inactive serine protease PAMR1-like [Salvelinus fontinalis]|uniref:inactive serine protease PAMR1-like n=1 Tax=Salvelinus fontinalis TaxID=8038 RepID=UPI002484DB03|nr:inactive serine protease PAMR1-like [Salvelinus fontinalis]